MGTHMGRRRLVAPFFVFFPLLLLWSPSTAFIVSPVLVWPAQFKFLWGRHAAPAAQPQQQTPAAGIPAEPYGQVPPKGGWTQGSFKWGVEGALLANMKEAEEAGDWDRVISLNDFMETSKMSRQWSHYQVVVRAMCELGKQDEALDLIFDLQCHGLHRYPHQDLLQIALDILGGKDSTVVEQLVPFFASLEAGYEVTYSAFLRACGHRQRPQLAHAFVGYLRRRGLKPSAAVYKAYLSCLRRGVAPISLLGEGVAAVKEDIPHWPRDLYVRAVIAGVGREATELAIGLMNEMRCKGHKGTRELFHQVIRYLARQGLWPQLHDTLKAMKQDGVPLTAESFNMIIKGFGSSGDWQAAMKVMGIMDEEKILMDAGSYTGLLTACRAAGELDTAVRWLHVMKVEKLITLEAFKIVAEILMQRDEWARLMNLVDSVRQVLPVDKVFWTALQAANGRITPKRALEVMSLMESVGLSPDERTYEVLLSAYVAGGWYSKALALVEQMKAQGVVTEGAYSYVIHSYNSLNHYLKAVGTISEMEAKGVPPGTRSYQEALAAAAKQLDLNTAKSLLSSMRRRNVTINGECYSFVVASCANNNQAIGVYEDIKAKEPQFEALRPSLSGAVLVSCAYRGFSRLALQVLDDLHLHESQSKGTMHGDMYSLTIQACTKGEGFKEVIKVYEVMRARGFRPTTADFNNVMNAHLKLGSMNPVLGLVEEMHTIGLAPDEDSYNLALAACAGSASYDQAKALLQNMTAAQVWPNEITSLVVKLGWSSSEREALLDLLAESGASGASSSNTKPRTRPNLDHDPDTHV